MQIAVFHRVADEVPWTFIDVYDGESTKDAVGALVGFVGQALAVPLNGGVAYKVSKAMRTVESPAVNVDDAAPARAVPADAEQSQ